MRHTSAIAILGAISILVFAPAFTYGFINFDDPMYVTENPVVLAGVTPGSLVEAFTDQSIALWTPLTIISYQIEVSLFGPNPQAMHATNILLHALNAILLYLFLIQLTARFWPSLFVAAVFAVHPTHVESVAWISERKDVLSTVFWLLTSIAWVRYVRTKDRRAYGLALVLFTLGLLAKPMVMTLPVVLLILDFWPLDRLRNRAALVNAVREKAPLFALAVGAALVTLVTQSAGDATVPATIWDRISNAVVAYAGYLGLTFYPIDLAVMYPRPLEPYTVSVVLVCAVPLIAITLAALARVRRAPFLLAGWAWFIVTLAPVAGAIPIGALAMADRYTYIPTIGLFIAVSFGGAAVLRDRSGVARAVAAGVAAVSVLVLSMLTFNQVRVWKDSETLFRHALAVTGPSVIPHVQLASLCLEESRVGEAEQHALAALALYPDFSLPNNILASVYIARGAYADAIPHLEKALKNEQIRPSVLQRLGAAHHALGRLEQAEAAYRESIQTSRDGGSIEAQAGLLQVLIPLGRADEAERLAHEFVLASPPSADLFLAAGTAASARGNLDQAERWYREALTLNPELTPAWFNYGNLRARRGDFEGAIEPYERVLALDPEHIRAHENLSQVYTELGDTVLSAAHRDRAAVLRGSSR